MHVGHKTSAFCVHEGGMLMAIACFDKWEHLGGKHEHQKMPIGDDHPINLVRADVKTSTMHACSEFDVS